jgi:tellurium resistance protein TerD
MAVTLSKGGNVSLSKEAPGLTAVTVGLGWDSRATDGADFDLDASVFLVDDSGKVRSDSDFIFYNNAKSSDGSIQHMGDNRDGEGEGDDEQVKIALDKVPADVKRMVFAVTIHEAESPSRASAKCRTPSSAWSTRRARRRSRAMTSRRISPPRPR